VSGGLCVWRFVCLEVCVSGGLCVWRFVCLCCVFVCLCVCVFVCLCVCVFVYFFWVGVSVCLGVFKKKMF